jgi:hypothetical protein
MLHNPTRSYSEEESVQRLVYMNKITQDVCKWQEEALGRRWGVKNVRGSKGREGSAFFQRKGRDRGYPIFFTEDCVFDGQNGTFATFLTYFWPAARERPTTNVFCAVFIAFYVLFVDFSQICVILGNFR